MGADLSAIVLAAGQGKRMKSALPKVLHEICEEPLVAYPVRLAVDLEASPVILVIGHGAAEVEAAVRARFPERVTFAFQAEQKGTGHAAMVGVERMAAFDGHVLILSGDVPLLRRATVERLREQAAATDRPLALVTAAVDDPTGYGRIVRDAGGRFLRIVEHRDATTDDRRVREINAGIYCVNAAFLRDALGALESANAQGEYYLTDLVQLATARGLEVATVQVEDPHEVHGANNRAQLAELARAMRSRINRSHMLQGVTLVDPAQTFIGPRVTIGRDSVIEPHVHLRGATRIGEGVHVDTGCVVTDARVEDGATLEAYSVVEGATVERNARAGPFARLRTGAHLMEEARVGNFVEIKKTRLGRGSKANHLTYLGDSVIGDGANIGAGTVTCNYDGYGKYSTRIADGVFIGSNATLVAPLEIEADAYIAAGSTITDTVGPRDLVLGRARQVVKPGRASALRKEAAERAAEAERSRPEKK